MDTMRLFSLLRRVPPGAWIAVIWCCYTVYSIRMFLGIPGMPYVPGQRFTPPAWLLLAAATTAAIAGSALLRRWPLPAVGLLLAGSSAAALDVHSPTIHLAHYLAADAALGAIVASRSRPAWIAALTAMLAVLPAYSILRSYLGYPPGLLQGWYLYALTAAVAWLAGNSVRLARGYAQESRTRAAAEAVTAERLRISRELHDMVAHSMGIIALQAGAAARVIDTQPERAHEALREVETASRETLAGLRRMLAAVRPDGPGQEPESSRKPAPGLADLERLTASATAAGVHVAVERRGEHRPLPPDIELAAYRVIQESVTNVIRHAGTSSCAVLIEQHEEHLSIEVADTGHGRGGTAGGTGHGLAGMRERVALLRGDFTAGPRPEGGFRVSARLPVPAQAQHA
ncbi:MAG: sensor histidine kinase [Streptosporangiaceae bacterium]|nr:sensor histidine kinase [Streptosporangiaceae bacterium]MBV9856083.1 sensor histidine kinase [Streptosporangiaceae bacterium]